MSGVSLVGGHASSVRVGDVDRNLKHSLREVAAPRALALLHGFDRMDSRYHGGACLAAAVEDINQEVYFDAIHLCVCARKGCALVSVSRNIDAFEREVQTFKPKPASQNLQTFWGHLGTPSLGNQKPWLALCWHFL